MSEEIKVGDLAVIVRPMPCCGAGKLIGHVFRVSAVRTVMLECLECHFRSVRTMLKADNGGVIDLWASKRIPPLSELEGEKRDEEITA